MDCNKISKSKSEDEETEERRVARNQLIPKILYKYQPADNVIFLDPESEKPERMIFEIQGSYLEHEELHLAELNELISCHELCSEINEFFDRANKLRFLQGNHFKLNKTLDNMIDHIQFVNHRIPKVLYKEALELLEKGLQYAHGRDRHFRPVVICKLSLLNKPNLDFEDAINAAFYSTFYMMDTLLVPGKCENWQVIIDLDSLAVFKLPIKNSIKFLQLSQDHEKCRTCMFFLVNVTFSIRAFYKIVSPFLDVKIKEKLIMAKESTHPKIFEVIHPSQVEKKYGGEADNLECYWPPKYISDEYGYDLQFIQDSNSENLSSDNKSELFDRVVLNKGLNPNRNPFILDNSFKQSKIGNICNNVYSEPQPSIVNLEEIEVKTPNTDFNTTDKANVMKSSVKKCHCNCCIF